MAKFTVSIPAGPIWDNGDAKVKGPIVAAAHNGNFNGQWRTVVDGMMSTVDVELDSTLAGSTEYTMDVLAGPIWNNDDAKVKCPVVCASYGGEWNGQWTTVVTGKMSVCGCKFKF